MKPLQLSRHSYDNSGACGGRDGREERMEAEFGQQQSLQDLPVSSRVAISGPCRIPVIRQTLETKAHCTSGQYNASWASIWKLISA